MARRIVNEISERLEFLNAVGLGYSSLDRSASSLSSGESQRIRLATQIGSKLRGVLYVLDEPSIGLHPRDNQRLLETLEQLRDMSNTVLVVEHDEETIRRADYVIDLGPGAGKQGGHVVAVGPPEKIAASADSLTGKYLSGEMSIPVPAKRRVANGKFITVLGARANNLKNIDVPFPFGLLTVVTGVSGSGKLTLVNDILHRAISKKLYRAIEDPGAHRAITGHGASRQDRRNRSSAHWTHAALQSRHVHRGLHAHSRAVRHAAGITRARLSGRAASAST